MLRTRRHPSSGDADLSYPPSTGGPPILGSLPRLAKNPFQFLEDATTEYGDVYALDLGLSSPVMLCSPMAAQHVFQTNADNYRKGGPLWELIRKLLGNGLVASEGDFWQRQRRMMQPEFHTKRLAALTELMIDAIQDALDLWEEDARLGKPVELVNNFNRVTMRVIVRTLFGSSLSKEEMDELGDGIGHALDYMIRGMIFNAAPSWMPLPGKRRFEDAIKTFDTVVYRLIDDCRHNRGTENHLLAMLLDAVDGETGDQMDDQQLRDEVATILLAGYETTSMALTWALAELDNRPDIAERLQSEIDEKLGGRRPTFDDLEGLSYARLVLDETLRLHPSAWQVPRVAIADDEIGGFKIDAGTNVVVLNYMIHRNPGFWDQPEVFDPERFTKDNSSDRHNFAYIPFGAGKRLCIGRSFALMEGTLALAMALQRFDINVVDSEVRPTLSTTLRPKGGLPATIARMPKAQHLS